MIYGAGLKAMPSQKKASREKTKAWMQENVDAGEGMTILHNPGIRQARLNKQINYDLFSGVLNKQDMERICNPFNISSGNSFPSDVKNYPITNPKIQALKGEELKRRFDWKVIVINPDAVSDKEEQLNSMYKSFLLQQIQAESESEEDLQRELQNFQSHINYQWQDERELSATRLLNYYTRHLDLKSVFNKGWEDAIISGEEVYAVDVINNEPVIRKCNPLNTYYLTSPDSNIIDDSDLIVEEFYSPVGQVIDMFYDELKPNDIEYIESHGKSGSYSTTGSGDVNYQSSQPTFLDAENSKLGVMFDPNTDLSSAGGAFDSNGNVRIVRVVWKSMRKIGILTYFNELGDEAETYVSEEYQIDKSKGETVRWIWIGEYWEGTKVADKIYVNLRPRPIQFRDLNNKSICKSGYVGTVYNTNSNKVQSLFDLMKPYQYAYNAYMYRTEQAMIKAVGKIGVLDLAMIPDNWDVDMWMHFAINMGWAIKDSFKEARKGAATGKLAGQMSGSSESINLEQGQFIQQNLQMLQYIEGQLDRITGITNVRQGLVQQDQGLGVTNQAVQASLNMTEWYFHIHDNTKLRVLRTLLETCKYCLKNQNKKIQFILDDFSSSIYEIDGELINEAEFGILVANATQDQETLNVLKQGVNAAFQTGQVDILQLLDIFSNESMSSIRRKTEKAVMDKQQREQMIRQQEAELQQQANQTQLQIAREQMDREDLNKEKDRQLELQLASLNVLNNPPGEDNTALIEQSRSLLKDKELMIKRETENLKLQQIAIQNRSQEKMQEKMLKMKEKELKQKKELEEKKLKKVKSK